MHESITKFLNAGEQLPNKENDLWLIVNGVVKSYTVDNLNRCLILGFWGKKDIVGYPLSSIEPYYLQCVTNVKIVAIHQSQFHSVSDKLSSRLKQIQQLSCIVRHSDVKNRLWLLLKWLRIKFGMECSAGQAINFPLTEEEIANILGISTLTTSNVLNQLQKENLIIYSEAKYIIFVIDL